jgi:hypothetical protein
MDYDYNVLSLAKISEKPVKIEYDSVEHEFKVVDPTCGMLLLRAKKDPILDVYIIGPGLRHDVKELTGMSLQSCRTITNERSQEKPEIEQVALSLLNASDTKGSHETGSGKFDYPDTDS